MANQGYDAMMRGDGWKNKLQSAMAAVVPSDMLAEIHRRMAEPGTGKKAA